MTDKELRRLGRMELIQILLEQAKELERMERELEEARKAADERQLLIHTAGSIAEASLKINGVMEAAQAAADQYVENVKREYAERAKQQYRQLQERLRVMEENAQAAQGAAPETDRGKAEEDDADGSA